jgi:hypothetical protein
MVLPRASGTTKSLRYEDEQVWGPVEGIEGVAWRWSNRRGVAAKKKTAGKREAVRKGDVLTGGVADVGLEGERQCEAGASRSHGYRAEFVGQVEKLCRLGARDEEVAEFFGVGMELLEEWKREHGEFAEAVRRGRVLADAEVADRLFLRARGYTHEAVRILSRGGKEEPVVVPYVEHYPPDTTACMFWLKNRRPDLWRDKVLDDGAGKKGDVVELTVGAEALEEIREAAGYAKGVVGPGEERNCAG